MAIADAISFFKRLDRDGDLKEMYRKAITDKDVRQIALEAGFQFTAEEFFAVAEDIPRQVKNSLIEELLSGTGPERVSFCEGCDDRGSSFCLTVCYWLKV